MTTIHCPECHQPLAVQPDALGKRLRCPACKATFLAEVPADRRGDEEERRPRAKRRAAGSSLGQALGQAALWFASGGVTALSGVVQPEANVPYVQWLQRACAALHAQPGAGELRRPRPG